MAAKRSITFPIYATDKASPTMRDVGRTAGNMGDSFRKVGAAIGVGLAVAGAAAVKFGIDSVQAFAAAQEAQNKLNFAYEKFPALADVSIDAIRRLNSSLALKTRYDDDATASAQAVLAQFGLTGDQLIRLTPLLQDYAARTGKDLTGAAEDLGRALLGQGRALKVIGLDLTDTGTLAGNFDALMAGLASTVGGFAEKDAETAAGKLDILRNRFGEVQEAVGEALMPALDRLLSWIEGDGLNSLEKFAAWFAEDGILAVQSFVDTISQMAEDGTLVPNILAGIAAITAAQWGMNAAMAANPVGLVIAGLVALGALGIAVATNWNTVTQIVASSVGGIVIGIGNMAVGIGIAINNVVNSLLLGIQPVVNLVNNVLRLLNLPTISIPTSVNFVKQLQGLVGMINSGISVAAQGGVGALALPKNLSNYGTFTNGGTRVFAEGGIVKPTPGGTRAIIGEAGQAEAVIPLSRSALAQYGLGGHGGDIINVNVPNGSFVGTKEQFAQWVVRAIEDAKRSGSVRSSALA